MMASKARCAVGGHASGATRTAKLMRRGHFQLKLRGSSSSTARCLCHFLLKGSDSDAQTFVSL